MDDGNVVGEVGHRTERRFPLRDDGFLELREMLDSHENKWKKGVLETSTDRFELRLTEEIATVRLEIAMARLSLLRWMFGFFVAYLGVTLSLMGMILRAAKLL